MSFNKALAREELSVGAVVAKFFISPEAEAVRIAQEPMHPPRTRCALGALSLSLTDRGDARQFADNLAVGEGYEAQRFSLKVKE